MRIATRAILRIWPFILLIFSLSLLGQTPERVNQSFQNEEDRLDNLYTQKIKDLDSHHLKLIESLEASKSSTKSLSKIKKAYSSMKTEIQAEYQNFRKEKTFLYKNWFQELIKANSLPAQKKKSPQEIADQEKRIKTWHTDIMNHLTNLIQGLNLEAEERVSGLLERSKENRENPGQGCGKGNKEIDLRLAKYSMADVAPRLQNNISNCFSHSAVQLYDAYLKSKGLLPKDFHSSAYMMSLLSDNVEQGQVCKTVNKMFHQGSCDEKQSESPLVEALAKYSKESLGEFNRRFDEEFTDHFKKKKGFWKKLTENKKQQQQSQKEYSEELCRQLEKLHLQEAFPVKVSSILDHLIKNPDNVNAFKHDLFNNCKEERKIPVTKGMVCNSIERNVLSLSVSNNYLNVIHDSLNRPTPQPVSISFCGNLLQKGKGYYGLSNNAKDLISKQKGLKLSLFLKREDCAAHSVVISGRREVHGVCQLKVTNSWGSNCQDLYHQDWIPNCLKGEIWINARDLMRNTFSLNWIDSKQK